MLSEIVHEHEHTARTSSNTLKPVMGTLIVPIMTGVPSSQVHFNIEVQFYSQEMQLRYLTGAPLFFTVQYVHGHSENSFVMLYQFGI